MHATLAPDPVLTAEPDLLAMSILVVDDEPANVALLQYVLAEAGFSQVRATTDPRLVWQFCRDAWPDLILLDLMMPHLSGFDVMRALRLGSPEASLPPILVLTADITTETKHRALTAGASDFLTKPFDQVEVLLRIRHLLKIQSQHQQLTRQNDWLEERVTERTGELRQALERLQRTIEQLQATQQQVIQHERLSALGAMAAGLAHDFNNALSLILGYSELLLEDLPQTAEQPQAGEFLQTIITAAQEAARVFGRLRGFYRPLDSEQPAQETSLNLLVEQAIAMTRPRWHSQALADGIEIQVQAQLGPDLPQLLADATELAEMLTNLIFNAVDAMPRGGKITLRTRLEAAALPAEANSAAECARLVIEVEDTGDGMPEEVRLRCLEPFFTTKGERGTGLGLSMVYGTMHRHGGSIDVQSVPGEGTCFILSLPLRTRAETAVAAAPVARDHVSWRILLVDDEPAFLSVLTHYLSHDRQLVETAADGEEALRKMRAQPYDLVITDRVMPGLSGDALAVQIKEFLPATRIILLTGFHDLQAAGEALPPGIDLIASKPITRQTLFASIREVMAGSLRPAARRVRGRTGSAKRPAGPTQAA